MIMKRNLLAVLIPALLATGASNAAEVYNKEGKKMELYGKVSGVHYLSRAVRSGGKITHPYGSNGDHSYARLGFKGETQITDQVTGYGQFEYQFSGSKPEIEEYMPYPNSSSKTRLAFAGLKFGDAGSIDYGRNYGVVHDALAWTDVLPEFGGDTAYADNFLVGHATGVTTYRNTNFFNQVQGLNFALQYQGANTRDDYRKANGDGFGGSVSYESPAGLGIVGAYGASDRTNLQEAASDNRGKGKRAEQWGTSVKYDANNVYLAATYAETRNATHLISGGFANKTRDIALVAQYQFDFGLRPSISYLRSRGKDIEGVGNGNEDIARYYEVGATYRFNKNMSTRADYIINDIKKTNQLGEPTEDTLAVGLTYQF
jgi:outer membrane pore protein F